MSANFYDLLKYAATGIASPDMTYFDRMRASTLMGGVVKTLTGIPPLTFKADGTQLISWSMKGNGQQSGTPTPDNPIQPDFVGKKDGADWTIPLTCGGQTTPVYLGQTQTVRKIRKLVLTGNDFDYRKNITQSDNYLYYIRLSDNSVGARKCMCTHLPLTSGAPEYDIGCNANGARVIYLNFGANVMNAQPSGNTVAGLKEYLASEYAAGTPVTVWYVLATPETAIVNEPLAKIGDYADELSSEDAGVSIPTVNGQNVLTVETELQPSEMTITYKG